MDHASAPPASRALLIAAAALALVLAAPGARGETNFAAPGPIAGWPEDHEDRDQPYIDAQAAKVLDGSRVRWTSLEQFFEHSRFGRLGPPRSLDPAGLEFLWDPSDALRRRLEELGYDPETGRIDGSCRWHEIDAVYMEWHVGAAKEMMAAALEAHARAGTRVRMVIGDTFYVTREDREGLERLRRAGAEVALLGGSRVDNFLDRYNKQMHTKILRVSKTCGEGGVETVILGGRNIKDSFYRTRAGSVLGRSGARRGANDTGLQYQDLDVRLRDSGLAEDARRVVEHLLGYAAGAPAPPPGLGPGADAAIVTEPGEVPEVGEAGPAGPDGGCRARLFSSVPFEGDRTWEDLFTGLMDHSGEEVVCIGSYFNPSARAWKAMEGAVGRGARVVLFANSQFKRDAVPSSLQGVVRERLNRALDSGIEVVEWNDPSVQHAKTCLFDRKVLYVGGANLNMRSFKHDTEAGVILSCPAAIEGWRKAVYEDVKSRSAPYARKPVGRLGRFLSRLIYYFY